MLERNGRILIVDDNRAIHDDFRKILASGSNSESGRLEAALFGDAQPDVESIFQLDSAYQGEAGFAMVSKALAEGEPYFLAFVDMRMPPGWDGLETIERIFECDPAIQVVICTAYSDSSWVDIRHRFGSTDRLLILKKPFDLAEVCQLACAMTEKWYLTEHARLAARRAQYDHLTDLPNRTLFAAGFLRNLDRARTSGELLAVFYIDLDHFKQVNDSFGHTVGDALLQEVARRLKGLASDCESLARVGGDEFLLLAGVGTAEAAGEIATTLLDSLAMPVNACGHSVTGSASIGISIFPKDGDTLETLVHHADSAMYESKRFASNGYRFFDAEIGDRASASLKTRARMHAAVDAGEFTLHYQPVYSLASGKMTGCEALIRWYDPARGIIGPAQFIPIAEDCGCIGRIENWVIEEACRQGRQWDMDGGPPFRVAINISASQFSGNDLVRRVEDTLGRTGVNPALLDLEMTETVLVRDLEKATETMKSLRALGLRISIDDFGTGYSSFNYLARFPFDVLKIDKSLVQGIQNDHRQLFVLESIVSLAHKLGIVVIAEGIEDQEQLTAVRDAGCDEAQGYLLGYPSLPEKIVRSRDLIALGDLRMSADLASLLMVQETAACSPQVFQP